MIEPTFAPLGCYQRLNHLQPDPFLDSAVKLLDDGASGDKQWERSLNLFQSTCLGLADPVEEAFYLVRASQAAAARAQWLKAGELVDKALQGFNDDSDSHALVEWMGGAVDWQLRRLHAGCKRWKHARQTLESQDQAAQRDRQPDKAGQIKSCLAELDRCLVDITASVDGGYQLLNQYQHSRLSQSSAELVQLMKKVLSSDQASRARSIMKLLEQSSGYDEYPEVMVECALASYRLEDVHETIRYLKTALVKYATDRGNLVAAWWMLAAAYGVEPNASKASESWVRCQTLIQIYLSDLDRLNSNQNTEKKELYEFLLVLLKLILEARFDPHPN